MGLASRGLRETEVPGEHAKVEDAAIVEASRRVARTIYRDGLVIGVVGALLAAATAWVR